MTTINNEKTYIIAEIGNNHEGDYTLAEELIGRAKESGADAVKFQTFITESFVSKSNVERFNRLKSFQLSFDEFERLEKTARKEGITFFSTPLDLESVLFLNPLVPFFKIASGDNDFYPLIDLVATCKKPIILSTGLAKYEQIEYTKARIENKWCDLGYKGELTILHCISDYPVRKEDLNLSVIPWMKQHFNCTIGYSDHSLGIEASVAAVAMGARVIEKHFTINKNHSDFRDHQLSADPAELKKLVQEIRTVETMLGCSSKVLSNTEEANLLSLRRGIAVNKALKQGHCIQLSDLVWIRPRVEFKPGDEMYIVGKELNKDLNEGDLLTHECFK